MACEPELLDIRFEYNEVDKVNELLQSEVDIQNKIVQEQKDANLQQFCEIKKVQEVEANIMIDFRSNLAAHDSMMA